jgi:tetratricopeptide (TPR) repeat protein
LILERARRDPGRALLVIALGVVVLAYAPTLARGLTNYDDPWLIGGNWIVRDPSLASLHAICCDLSRTTRFVLGAEYLPVRDLSVMADAAVWGSWYGGYHLTNLLVYGGAMVAWFSALCALGIERRVAGIAVLLWALHPAHAESVAWLAERKGLLGALFAGLAALGYARWRTGASWRWLAGAAIASVAAVWSKAPSAFALASLAPLELVLPGRVSWRRSITGLAVIAAAAGAAFAPVLLVARTMDVVTQAPIGPQPGVALALGLHGFYARVAALAVRDSVSYPIAIDGATTFDIVLGAVTLAGLIALLVRGRWPLRAGAIVWLVCWLPLSRLVLPVRGVVVADRYLLLGSLGLAVIAAAALDRLPRYRTALVLTIAFASALRTLDAQANWRDAITLWQRATEVNPRDADAWSMYAEALDDGGEPQRAIEAVMAGTHQAYSPRLIMREALIILEHGDRAQGEALMKRAAEGGEERAMSNYAALVLHDGNTAEALTWARKATAAAPQYVNGQRIRGKVALAAGHPDEALAAFDAVLALEPQNPANHLNAALALLALGRTAEARPHLQACLGDPRVGAQARQLLEGL